LQGGIALNYRTLFETSRCFLLRSPVSHLYYIPFSNKAEQFFQKNCFDIFKLHETTSNESDFTSVETGFCSADPSRLYPLPKARSAPGKEEREARFELSAQDTEKYASLEHFFRNFNFDFESILDRTGQKVYCKRHKSNHNPEEKDTPAWSELREGMNQ